jgi:hypothetical protein
MKSIWKFQIEATDVQEIEMPEGAELLTIQVQNGIVCLWALVSPNAPKEKRTLRVYGTGHPITSGGLHYIGTFQLLSGGLVFHVFEQKA